MDAQIQIQAVFLQPTNPSNAKYLASKPSQEKTINIMNFLLPPAD
jgi:hypothetical protein